MQVLLTMMCKIVASVLFCVFANGFGRPVPHSLHKSHLETLSADPQQRGQALAEKLKEVLPATGSVAQQLEPAVSHVQESDESRQSRSELLAAASLFNAASSDNTEEQQAAEDALREAMASPSTVGHPDRNIDESAASSCLPDLSQCPHGWKKQGALCIASAAYSGPCAAEADLSEMSVEQKLAYANFCSVRFPCQEHCAQDFQQNCPSLWREIGSGICAAPIHYAGDCSTRVKTADMSEEAKYAWSVRCAARWPCAKDLVGYAEICPKGWSLEPLSKVCIAPHMYSGPCEPKAYMFGATDAEKKKLETMCNVQWNDERSECMRNLDATCPVGWQRDGSKCFAPSTYKTCSKHKSFAGMTPAAKLDWAHNCKVQWPCA